MGDTIERRSLSLQGAQRVLEAAIGQAAQAGLHVSVAVLGSAGQLKAFAAMDGIAAFGGGVPIKVGGHTVGAVAVSGASSAQDEEIAHKAAAVLG